MSITVELDARGLQCPLPLLKLKQQLNKLVPGDKVCVQTTDAGSVRDFQAFVQQARHQLHECRETDGIFHFVIEKG
jgi:tRNA 2-thiouridine synthesizing protein A